MVDQSERAFRLLTRRHGVDLAYTPMLHAEPFAADEKYRRVFFDAWEAAADRGVENADRPLIAQLGGDDPQTMLRAARILEPYVDAIDINFGCPTEDARRGGKSSHSPRCRRFGAYLLPDLPLVQRIVGTLAHGLLQVPVTAKIRIMETQSATLDIAQAIEEAGAVALCVHGRTVNQRPKYADRDRTGKASLHPNWQAIGMIRRTVGIPVIANGGIETRQDAVRCLEVTGAAAVMSAEALLEDPDLFSCSSVEEKEEKEEDCDAAKPRPEVRRMLRLAREFLELAERFPSTLEYPPVKSHLFKMLHRVMGADQAETRKKYDAGHTLELREELKLELMRCKYDNMVAIRAALDTIEANYSVSPWPEIGPSWYRRWRS